MNNFEVIRFTLRILGPCNGGVGTCIAGVVRVLKIGTFEGLGYLG